MRCNKVETKEKQSETSKFEEVYIRLFPFLFLIFFGLGLGELCVWRLEQPSMIPFFSEKGSGWLTGIYMTIAMGVVVLFGYLFKDEGGGIP